MQRTRFAQGRTTLCSGGSPGLSPQPPPPLPPPPHPPPRRSRRPPSPSRPGTCGNPRHSREWRCRAPPGAGCDNRLTMPIYEYRCRNGHQFEVFQAILDPPVTACQECGAPVERVFHPVAVALQGLGLLHHRLRAQGAPRAPRKAARTPRTPRSRKSREGVEGVEGLEGLQAEQTGHHLLEEGRLGRPEALARGLDGEKVADTATSTTKNWNSADHRQRLAGR